LGVYWVKGRQKWRARVKKNGKTRSFGMYDCELEAAKAYDAAALELHGDFANLNFPHIDTPKQIS
jgi:hypothetical protein